MNTNVTGVLRKLSVRSFGRRRLLGSTTTRHSFGRITSDQGEALVHTVVRKRNVATNTSN